VTSNFDIERRLLFDAIYLRYHYDFRGYAEASAKRRVQAAMIRLACATVSQLQDRVLHDPAAFADVLDVLTVPVSEMFRDPGYFKALRDHVVPILRSRGLFRTEYTASTLRGHYGLQRPANSNLLAAATR